MQKAVARVTSPSLSVDFKVLPLYGIDALAVPKPSNIPDKEISSPPVYGAILPSYLRASV